MYRDFFHINMISRGGIGSSIRNFFTLDDKFPSGLGINPTPRFIATDPIMTLSCVVSSIILGVIPASLKISSR